MSFLRPTAVIPALIAFFILMIFNALPAFQKKGQGHGSGPPEDHVAGSSEGLIRAPASSARGPHVAAHDRNLQLNSSFRRMLTRIRGLGGKNLEEAILGDRTLLRQSSSEVGSREFQGAEGRARRKGSRTTER